MATNSVITITTGPAGSGKSFRRCPHFLLNDFLPEGEGVHYSNFPIHRDKLAEAAAKRLKVHVDDVLDRIQVIEPHVMQAWAAGDSGPWDYFREVDLQGCHVAIDEIHNYCGSKHSTKIKKAWQIWLGEIRHRGASIELLSQHPNKVAKELDHEAGTRLSLINSESRRDPWFRILLGDWYELRAAWLTREYTSSVWEIEKRDVDGRWMVEDTRIFPLDPYYFQFYDSYSRPQSGGLKADGIKRQFERRSRNGLTWWFFKRNWWRLGTRMLVLTFLLYLIGGGGGQLFGLFMAYFTTFQRPQAQSATEATVPGEPLPAPPAPVGANEPAPPDPRIAELELRLADLQTRYEGLGMRHDDLRDRVERSFAIALITQDAVTFHNGYTYHVRDQIDFGPFQGLRVQHIDWQKRTVRLSNNSILRMAVAAPEPDGLYRPELVASAPGPRRPPVRRSLLPTGGDDGPQPTLAPGWRSALHDISGSDAPGGLPEVGQQSNGGVSSE